MKFMKANRIAPDGTSHFVASYLGLFCLPMSHKKDARLIWVNVLDPNITLVREGAIKICSFSYISSKKLLMPEIKE